MLLYVTIIKIRGIFACEQTRLIVLLCLYFSILEIGCDRTYKLTFCIILLVDDSKTAFTLQFTAHIVSSELLRCRSISRIESQAVISGESLIRGYFPIFIVIDGIEPVLRYRRRFWDTVHLHSCLILHSGRGLPLLVLQLAYRFKPLHVLYLLSQGNLSHRESNHHDDDRILFSNHTYIVLNS